jgi:hypothetical protein
MNSQALQKRIIDGKLFFPRHAEERLNVGLQASPSETAEEGLRSEDTDTGRTEYPAFSIPDHKVITWRIGSRLRAG